ncbi:Sfum_1244 family protein [Variovorax sp. YR752]|uniref:Sfum_1244 family protein n=1 Tax=Variovorax sp. YR752 TaxID=1884383 RepID=UPI00313817DC
MTLPIGPLIAAVQTNCHIADARHAADLSLCTFLLQMREFYRWEKGLPLGAALSRDAIGQWLARREARWAELEGRDFVPLPGGATGEVDPFDAERLNRLLRPHGMVYGAGLLGPGRPTFFMARLEAVRPVADGITLQVCGAELARGLIAPPAALQGNTIVLRRESMARWLWEKFEALGLKKLEGPFRAVSQAYGLEEDFHAALPRLLDEQSRTLVLHEIGEHRAGRWLEPGWAAMRLALHERRTELLVRAVRDHIADFTHTLPTLLAESSASSIHFWFAGFDGVRRQLFPSLADSYRAWCAGDAGQALQREVARGALHFTQLAEQVLALHAQHGAEAGGPIAARLNAPAAVCGA